MLAHPTHPPRATTAVLARTDEAGLLAQVERCRLAAVPLAHPERQFSLQVFDLGRLRARLGLRWEGLRYRAVGQIQTGLARELGEEELAIDGGGDLLFAIRSAPDRREVERHGELLAAEVTARLCGTLPGGAIVRVTTLPFDPTTELVGATTAEIAAGLARRLDPTATADQATTDNAALSPCGRGSARCFICASGSSPPIGSTWPTDPTSRNSTRPRPTHGPWSSWRDSCAAQPMAETRPSWSRCISPP